MDMSDSDDGAAVPVYAPRARPNILITGTPGTGKTTTAELVCDMLGGFTRYNVGELVKEGRFYSGVDEFGALEIDQEAEDRLLDHMEVLLAGGGCVVEHLGCELFPERWFDLVVVLTCDNTLLYDRLLARGYAPAKITENVQAEIMQVVLIEAQESYKPEVVLVLPSESAAQLQSNAAAIVARIRGPR